MRLFMATCALVFLTFAGACAKSDPAVAEFDTNLRRTSEAVTNAGGASYLYRLSETPEEQVMQELLPKIGRRRATQAEIQRAIETEEARRTKYIDGLDNEIDAARAVLADLSRTANAIRDDELRTSARAIVSHYDEVLQQCSRIARAQRARSSATSRFLEDLAAKREIAASSALENADAEAKEARSRLEQMTGNDKLLTAQFRGIRQRKDHRSVFE